MFVLESCETRIRVNDWLYSAFFTYVELFKAVVKWMCCTISMVVCEDMTDCWLVVCFVFHIVGPETKYRHNSDVITPGAK